MPPFQTLHLCTAETTFQTEDVLELAISDKDPLDLLFFDDSGLMAAPCGLFAY